MSSRPPSARRTKVELWGRTEVASATTPEGTQLSLDPQECQDLSGILAQFSSIPRVEGNLGCGGRLHPGRAPAAEQGHPNSPAMSHPGGQGHLGFIPKSQSSSSWEVRIPKSRNSSCRRCRSQNPTFRGTYPKILKFHLRRGPDPKIPKILLAEGADPKVPIFRVPWRCRPQNPKLPLQNPEILLLGEKQIPKCL